MINTIIILILLFLVTLGSAFWLFRQQKKERTFERKGVLLYAFVIFLIFAFIGLFGLLGQEKLQTWFLIAQGLAIIVGLINIWQLFSNYEWSDKGSYLPENLFTVFISCIGVIGLLVSYWFFYTYFGKGDLLEKGAIQSLAFAKSAFWLPIPYLLNRTYHLILEVPSRLHKAWYFHGLPSRGILDYDKKKVIYTYWNLDKDNGKNTPNKIVDFRARFPKRGSLEDIFVKFIKDFNSKNIDSPVINLREDGKGNPLGWRLYAARNRRGVRKMLRMEEQGLGQIEEGDFLFAERVPIAKSDAVSKPRGNPEDDIDLEAEDDFEIEITEK